MIRFGVLVIWLVSLFGLGRFQGQQYGHAVHHGGQHGSDAQVGWLVSPGHSAPHSAIHTPQASGVRQTRLGSPRQLIDGDTFSDIHGGPIGNHGSHDPHGTHGIAGVSAGRSGSHGNPSTISAALDVPMEIPPGMSMEEARRSGILDALAHDASVRGGGGGVMTVPESQPAIVQVQPQLVISSAHASPVDAAINIPMEVPAGMSMEEARRSGILDALAHDSLARGGSASSPQGSHLQTIPVQAPFPSNIPSGSPGHVHPETSLRGSPLPGNAVPVIDPNLSPTDPFFLGSVEHFGKPRGSIDGLLPGRMGRRGRARGSNGRRGRNRGRIRTRGIGNDKHVKPVIDPVDVVIDSSGAIIPVGSQSLSGPSPPNHLGLGHGVQRTNVGLPGIIGVQEHALLSGPRDIRGHDHGGIAVLPGQVARPGPGAGGGILDELMRANVQIGSGGATNTPLLSWQGRADRNNPVQISRSGPVRSNTQPDIAISVLGGGINPFGPNQGNPLTQQLGNTLLNVIGNMLG